MNDGGITYGPSGSSFAVWDGRRRVQTCRTLLGAKVEATKLTARLGGEAVEVGRAPDIDDADFDLDDLVTQP